MYKTFEEFSNDTNYIIDVLSIYDDIHDIFNILNKDKYWVDEVKGIDPDSEKGHNVILGLLGDNFNTFRYDDYAIYFKVLMLYDNTLLVLVDDDEDVVEKINQPLVDFLNNKGWHKATNLKTDKEKRSYLYEDNTHTYYIEFYNIDEKKYDIYYR